MLPVDVYDFGFGNSQTGDILTPARGSNGVAWTTGNEITHADAMSSALSALPSGKKAFMVGAGSGFNADQIFTKTWLHDGTGARSDIIDLITNGADTAEGISVMNAVWDRVIANGHDIENIFLDIESGTIATYRRISVDGTENGMWYTAGSLMDAATREAKVQSILDNAGAAAQLPEWLKSGITVSDFGSNWQDEDNASMINWNKWAFWKDSMAIRSYMKDTAETKFGHDVRTLNWRETVISWQTRDNQSVQNGTSSIQGVCNWPIYMNNGVSGSYYTSATKNGRWNHMITSLNAYRSCIAAGGTVIPWIGLPTYNGGSPSSSSSFGENPWLWKEMIKHLYAMGVNTYLLFTRDGAMATDVPAEEKMAVDHFRTLEDVDRSVFDTTEIPVDSNEIVTGKLVTKYDESLL